MNDKSKEIEQEINNLIDLILHFDKFYSNLKEKEKELKLTDNSKEIINEFTENKKITNFLIHDEKFKKHRSSIGIFKQIKTMLSKEKSKNKNTHLKRKINPINFNQNSLLSDGYYSGAEAEYYFIGGVVKRKILDIVKSCFEKKFNENEKKILEYKNNSLEKKNNFILISNNNFKKEKLKIRYYNSLISKNSQGILSMKDYFAKTNNSKFIGKNIINNSRISFYDISKNIPKSNSCINIMDYSLNNKNSILTNEKYTSVNFKNNTLENAKDNRNKNYNKKRNIILLNKKKYQDFEKSFMPLLNVSDFKYKNEVRFKPQKIPSFDSGIMELIHFNTKNNIKIKAEEEFLKECLKETYIGLRNVNPFYESKCFVDYSRRIVKNYDDIYAKKNYNAPPKEKKFYEGFEYKNIYKYAIIEKLWRLKK